MKITFAIATLLASSTSAVKLRDVATSATPWDVSTLPECPADSKRTVMDDCKTHVVKWPMVGASCKLQVEDNLIQTEEQPKNLDNPTPWDRATLPDCPADKTRTRMDDFITHVSKYPNVGATCKL